MLEKRIPNKLLSEQDAFLGLLYSFSVVSSPQRWALVLLRQVPKAGSRGVSWGG